MEETNIANQNIDIQQQPQQQQQPTVIEAQPIPVVASEPVDVPTSAGAPINAEDAVASYNEAFAKAVDIAPAAQSFSSIAGQAIDIVDTVSGANLGQIVLTPEDQAVVAQRASEIELSDVNRIIDFGSASQAGIAQFSNTALDNVRTKNLGETGNMIATLVTDLKGFSIDEPEKKGLFGLFKKAGNKMEMMKARYADVEKNVGDVELKLHEHQNRLTRDIVLLDKMYQANLAYYKDLTLYILAGKKRLEEERAGKLVELRAKAAESNLPEDAQAASDYANMLDRLEKKIYDLELSRTISIQMAPQIRLIQSSDVLMSEKIQSSLVNTIPLWKNQMVLALGMENVKEATEAQRQVADLTNELLKKNAETLKQGTVDVATESERAIVEVETLEETNQKLIETFDEVLRIQEEGRVKRVEAEAKIAALENELKGKMLELSSK